MIITEGRPYDALIFFFVLYIKHCHLSISSLIHRFSALFPLNLNICLNGKRNDSFGFGMMVRIALQAKGIRYEYKEKNLPEKSPLLLMSNKMIPVLINKM